MYWNFWNVFSFVFTLFTLTEPLQEKVIIMEREVNCHLVLFLERFKTSKINTMRHFIKIWVVNNLCIQYLYPNLFADISSKPIEQPLECLSSSSETSEPESQTFHRTWSYEDILLHEGLYWVVYISGGVDIGWCIYRVARRGTVARAAVVRQRKGAS